jgi:hydrogenase maturation protein HypF
MAAGYVSRLSACDRREFEPFFATLPPAERAILPRQIETGVNVPLTSSCGRLFDAAAALLGVRLEAWYEGQPAVELEAVSDPAVRRCYPFELIPGESRWIIDPSSALVALWQDRQAGTPVPVIAAAFHNTVAAFTVDACRAVREAHGLEKVVLSGGCFQNALLTQRVLQGLAGAGFQVFTQRTVPPNDGGLSLGQAVVAYARVASA